MDYRIEFSYIKNGKRVSEYDTIYRFTAQDAVDEIREWYNDLDGFRIETVWKDNCNHWEITEAWN